MEKMKSVLPLRSIKKLSNSKICPRMDTSPMTEFTSLRAINSSSKSLP